MPSGAYAANEAFLAWSLVAWSLVAWSLVAWSLVAWALLDRQVERLGKHLPASSRWRRAVLLLDAFRGMVWGQWTWTAIWSHLEALSRYLRPSRPPNQLWSMNPILSHLELVLASAYVRTNGAAPLVGVRGNAPARRRQRTA